MFKRHNFIFPLAFVSLFFLTQFAHSQFGPGWGFNSFGSPYNSFGGFGGGGSIGWGVPNGQSKFQMVPSFGGAPTVTMNNGAWGNFAGTGSAISLGAASVLGSMYGIPIGIPGYGAMGGVAPWGFGGSGFGGGGGFGGMGGGFNFGGTLGGWSRMGGGGGFGFGLPGIFPSYSYNPCMFTYCGAAAGVGVYGNSGHYVDTGCFYSYCDQTRSSGRYGRGDDREWYERPVHVPGSGEVGLPPNIPAPSAPGILIADTQSPPPPPPPEVDAPIPEPPKMGADPVTPDVPPQEPAPAVLNPEGLAEPEEPTDLCVDRYKKYLDGNSSSSNCYSCMAAGEDFEELKPISLQQTENATEIVQTIAKQYGVASGARRFAAAYYQTCEVVKFDNIYCSGQNVQGVKHGATSQRTIDSIQEIIQSHQYLKIKCEGADLKDTCNDICQKAAVFGLGSWLGVKQTPKTGALEIQPRSGRSTFNNVNPQAKPKFGNMGSLDCSQTVSKMLMATGRRMWPRSKNMSDNNMASYLMTTDKIYAAANAKGTCFATPDTESGLRPGDLIVRPLNKAKKPGHVVIVDRVFNQDPFGLKHRDLQGDNGKILCDKIEARYFKFDVWTVDGVGSRNLVKTPANDFFARVDVETAKGLIQIAKAQCNKINGGPKQSMTYKPASGGWPVAIARHKGEDPLCMHKDPSKITLDGETCAKDCQ
jgi:hypothetical protein